MSKGYGRMIGFKDAVAWVENMAVPEHCQETKQWVLNRLRYQYDQTIPVKVKLDKGRFMSYYCGNCRHGVDCVDKFCSGCGFPLDFKEVHSG